MNLYTHGIIRPDSNPAYDADALAYFTAAGITDTGQKNGANQFILDLKGYGLWSKGKIIDLILGGSSTSHKYNAKNPLDTDAAFRLTFYGGITHDANGMTGNGTNGYANTYFIPSTHGSLNNFSAFIYSRTNAAGGYVDFGSIKVTSPQHRIQVNGKNASNNFTSACNDATVSSTASSRSDGFIGISRISSGSYKQVRNTTKTTISVTSTALNSDSMYLMAVNSGGPANYSPRTISFFWVGEGLTDTEIDNLYTAVQTFETSQSRQV